MLLVGTGPGIGMSLARRFGREGFEIIMVARSAEKLAGFQKELAAEGIASHSCPADLTDLAGLQSILEKTVAEHGPVDLLHYNASNWRPALIADIGIAGFMDDFKTSVAGVLVAVQAVLPGMKERRGGTIFFTGGGSAFTHTPKLAALGLGKAAMRHFAFSLAEEAKGLGIRVGTVTVCGAVQPGTRFDPSLIADEFWRLFNESEAGFQTEVVWK